MPTIERPTPSTAALAAAPAQRPTWFASKLASLVAFVRLSHGALENRILGRRLLGWRPAPAGWQEE